MSAIIEYILAVFIGGAIMLILIRAGEQTNESALIANNDQNAQSLIVSTADVIEYDMANIGSGVASGTAAVIAADSARFVFLTDLNDDGGVPDTITYFTNDSSSVTVTANIHDRHLFRKTNLSSTEKIGLVTRFILRYATRSGEVLSTPVISTRLIEIYTIEFSMEMQSGSGVSRHVTNNQAWYSSAFWQRTYALN